MAPFVVVCLTQIWLTSFPISSNKLIFIALCYTEMQHSWLYVYSKILSCQDVAILLADHLGAPRICNTGFSICFAVEGNTHALVASAVLGSVLHPTGVLFRLILFPLMCIYLMIPDVQNG